MADLRFCLPVITLIFGFGNKLANSQYTGQNMSVVPYPYQTALGLAPYPGMQGVPVATPNTTQSSNNYYAMLAQQGIPAYQYPIGPGMGYPHQYSIGPGMGYPQPGLGHPPPGFGYPPPGFGYPSPGFVYLPGIGYPPPGVGYPQPVIGYPLGGYGHPQSIGYPQTIQGKTQQGTGQQQYGNSLDPYANIKAEIIDVSPEYQRQILGLPENPSSGSGDTKSTDGNTGQGGQHVQPKYNVKIDSQSSNLTSIPTNLTKPIVTTKQFTTSIRRTFVYDSSKPGENKPINLHFINGELVTTTEPPTTTENENVEDSAVTIKGRRYMDVPKSCPKGQYLGHNGKCTEPFFFANLNLRKNTTLENTTQSPADELNNEKGTEDPGATTRKRRFVNIPKSCPKGTSLTHSGNCIRPFILVKLNAKKNVSVENTTWAKAGDELKMESRNESNM